MQSLNENYLKGLINATRIIFEKNDSIDEKMQVNWSFDKNGKDMRVICEFTACIDYKDVINDEMTPNYLEEKPYNEKDGFIVNEDNHDEEHFVDYTNAILERLSKIKLN